MVINSSGNVGIGTSTPSSLLQVAGDITPEADSTRSMGSAALRFANAFTRGVNSGINTLSISSGGALFNVSGTDRVRIVEGLRVGNAYVNIAAPNDGAIISGNVGIGATNPAYKLTVNGEPAANGYTAFTNYSDRRLKHNIALLPEGALNKIMKLRPSTFQYNELTGYDEATRSKNLRGFIAQELREVFPEMVSETKISGTSYLDTNLSYLQIYLVKAMQELFKTVESWFNTHEQAIAEHDLRIEVLEKENAVLLKRNEEIRRENDEIKIFLCSKDSSAPFCGNR